MKRLQKSMDFLASSGSAVICSLIVFIYNLYVKTYVMPYEFGIYTTATLFFTYLSYLQLGVLNSFNRDYPKILGSGDIVAAEQMRRSVFTYVFILYIIVAILGILVSCMLVYAKLLNDLLGFGIAINSANAGLLIMYNFFDNSTKAEGKIVYASVIYIIKTAFLVAVGFFSVRQWGYWGLFIAAMASAIIPFFFYIKRIVILRFYLDKIMLWELLKTGAPLLVNSLIWTVMISIDRFVILAFMTMTDLGIYSTALLGFSTLVLIPTSISQVFYIKLSKKYGETGSREVLFAYADKFTYYLSLCTCIVSLLAYFGLPIIINTFIPVYASGIESAQILILGVSLYSTTLLYSNVFSVFRMNAKLIKTTIFLCIFTAIFTTVFVIIFGKHIENVAYGTTLSYALYSIIMVTILGKTLKRSALKMLVNSWLPVICVNAPCLLFSLLTSSYYIAFFESAALASILLGLIYLQKRQKKLTV